MKKSYLLVSLCLFIYGFAIAQPTVPPNPAAGNTTNCTKNAAIMTCPANSSGVQTSFQNGLYNRGNNGNRLGVGAIWRFPNITTVSGVQVNAEVKIDAISNATLQNSGSGSNTSNDARIEDDDAKDQEDHSIASFFAPRISPNASGNGNVRGYVQFTMTFYNNAAYTSGQNLTNLNFVHLDIDGNGNSSAWFRETGTALSYGPSNPTVIANLNTELSAYNYTDNTTAPGGSWTGFAGSVYERVGVSVCAEVAVAYRYSGNRNSITFRMGYDYKGTGNPGSTARQYGGTFGCFNFPAEIPLPVKLISFNGAYNNQHTLLNWATEEEQNFDHFEIQRSSNGFDYTSVGTRASLGLTIRSDYEFNDDLSTENGNLFYYRLRIVDKDSKYTYSKVVLIKKDNKSINGLSINPNPVTNGTATVKMSSPTRGTIELRVVDISGRILVKQTQRIYEGNNAITIDVQKLQPGIYTMQIAQSDAMISAKFSIVR